VRMNEILFRRVSQSIWNTSRNSVEIGLLSGFDGMISFICAHHLRQIGVCAMRSTAARPRFRQNRKAAACLVQEYRIVMHAVCLSVCSSSGHMGLCLR